MRTLRSAAPEAGLWVRHPDLACGAVHGSRTDMHACMHVFPAPHAGRLAPLLQLLCTWRMRSARPIIMMGWRDIIHTQCMHAAVPRRQPCHARTSMHAAAEGDLAAASPDGARLEGLDDRVARKRALRLVAQVEDGRLSGHGTAGQDPERGWDRGHVCGVGGRASSRCLCAQEACCAG